MSSTPGLSAHNRDFYTFSAWVFLRLKSGYHGFTGGFRHMSAKLPKQNLPVVRKLSYTFLARPLRFLAPFPGISPHGPLLGFLLVQAGTLPVIAKRY